MNENLFRQEVLQNKTRRLSGDLIISTSVTSRLLVTFLVAAVIFTLVFLVSGSFSRKQTVHGILMPDKGVVDIYPAVGGTVSEVFVQQGTFLEKGQRLLSIVENAGQLGSQPLVTAHAANIEHEMTLLQGQLQELGKKHELDRDKHDRQVEALEIAREQQQKILETELAMLEIQIRSLSRVNRLVALDVLPDNELDLKEYEVLALRARIETRKGDIQDFSRTIEQEQIATEESRYNYQERKSLLQRQINNLESQQLTIQARAGTGIVTPVSGTVSQINVYEGMTVDARQELLSILPEGSTLQAWLQVPASAIGFIREGQKIIIRYSTFAYQKFGVFEGRIRKVPDNAVTTDALNGEPYYRVIAELNQQYIVAYGEVLPLRAGISLDADIILDKRSLLEWLLDPLYSIGLRS